MAGRRMKAAVGDEMERRGIEPRVVVSGLTNEYIHYVVTREEYEVIWYFLTDLKIRLSMSTGVSTFARLPMILFREDRILMIMFAGLGIV